MSSTKEFNRYWSPEVEELVKQIKEARERKNTAITEFQFTVLSAFSQDYPLWKEAVDIVAQIDCLLSLSKASSNIQPAVRPEIIESSTAFVEFENLRHPCVFSASSDFIANDVKLGRGQNMILLTGPNVSFVPHTRRTRLNHALPADGR